MLLVGKLLWFHVVSNQPPQWAGYCAGMPVDSHDRDHDWPPHFEKRIKPFLVISFAPCNTVSAHYQHAWLRRVWQARTGRLPTNFSMFPLGKQNCIFACILPGSTASETAPCDMRFKADPVMSAVPKMVKPGVRIENFSELRKCMQMGTRYYPLPRRLSRKIAIYVSEEGDGSHTLPGCDDWK